MIELGELEAHHAEFARGGVQVVVVSVEGTKEALDSQKDFPNLIVLSDANQQLAAAVDVIHKNSKPGGGDTSAPTTILIDRQGTVKWLFRPDRHLVRLSARAVLDAVDQHLGADKKE